MLRPYLLFRRFCKNENGSILIMMGLVLAVLVAAAGAGVDFGLNSLARNKMQTSADLAATSAGGYENPDGSATGDTDRAVAAERFYHLNFRSAYMGIPAAGTGNVPAINVSGNTILVTPQSLALSTHFSRLADNNSLSVDAASNVGFTPPPANKTDIYLALDNSDSMLNPDAGGGLTRLAALKAASLSLATDLLGTTPGPNHRIAAVSWNQGITTTLSFTNDKVLASNYINGMLTGNGTDASIALQYIISHMSSFRTSSDVVKSVVLMTDGMNASFAKPYPNGNTQSINAAALAQCQALKNAGIIIYTVGLGTDVTGPCRIIDYMTGATNNSLAHYCSSTPPSNYYYFGGFFNAPVAAYGGGGCAGRAKPFSITSATYCPTPFLTACATSAQHVFFANNASQLNTAFQTIAAMNKKVRVMH